MKNKTQNLPETLTWKATSHSPRTAGWYAGFVLIGVGLMAFALFYDRSMTTIITFALILIIVGLLNTGHRVNIYKITKTGLVSGNTMYPYKIVKFFWIQYDPPDVTRLNFETNAYLNNRVSFELGDQDPLLVKLVLNQYLSEDLDRAERLSEALARRLKI